MRSDHGLASLGSVVNGLDDDNAKVLAAGRHDRLRHQDAADVHRPLGQSGEEPGQEALPPLRVGDERGVDSFLLRGERDDLLVDVAEAQTIGDSATDRFASGASRVRDRHHSGRDSSSSWNGAVRGLLGPDYTSVDA